MCFTLARSKNNKENTEKEEENNRKFITKKRTLEKLKVQIKCVKRVKKEEEKNYYNDDDVKNTTNESTCAVQTEIHCRFFLLWKEIYEHLLFLGVIVFANQFETKQNNTRKSSHIQPQRRNHFLLPTTHRSVTERAAAEAEVVFIQSKSR